MWMILALSAALQPAPAKGDLEIKNARFTRGVLGAARAGDKYLPGDLVVLSFDAKGLRADGAGRVRLALGVELSRKGAARAEQAQLPVDREAALPFGGDQLPMHAVGTIGTDTAPGQYVMKVTLADKVGKGKVELVRAFEVLPAALGFVQVGLAYNEEQPAPPVAVPGQTLFLHYGVVGFTRDKKAGQADLALEVSILDAKGKPTTARPFGGKVKNVKDGFEQFIPFEPIGLPTSRPGKFRVVLKVTDNAAKKSAEYSLDLTVLEAP